VLDLRITLNRTPLSLDDFYRIVGALRNFEFVSEVDLLITPDATPIQKDDKDSEKYSPERLASAMALVEKIAGLSKAKHSSEPVLLSVQDQLCSIIEMARGIAR